MFIYFSSSLQCKMHSLHAFFLQFFVFHDISKPAYLPKSWTSPKITNTVLLKSFVISNKDDEENFDKGSDLALTLD